MSVEGQQARLNRRRREVICRRGKRPYANRKEAAFVAAKVRREHQQNVEPYHCEVCHCWHIGHPRTT